MLKREPFFLILLLVIAAALQLLFFGASGFSVEKTTAINIGDTYYVVSVLYIFPGIFCILLFSGNGLKLLIQKKSEIATVLFFIIASGVLLVFSTQFLSALHEMQSADEATTMLIKILNSIRLFVALLASITLVFIGKKIYKRFSNS